MKAWMLLSSVGLAGAAVLVAQIGAGAGAAPPSLARNVLPAGAGEDDGGGIAGTCTPGTGPDVIVGDLTPGTGGALSKYGTVGGITGYSVGTTSCNLGDTPLLWSAGTNNHPVIAQNLYRLENGRFEQVGMSWLKHGFAALTQNLCCTCNDPGTSQLLGVGCSDPYGAGLNGNQTGLGPRYQVNATTGAFSYPFDQQGVTGDAVFKRLQVHNTDLDPSQHAGALYFVEGHYVTPDEAAAANHHNNASYRQVTVGTFSGGGWNLVLSGTTVRQVPALYAWRSADPLVKVAKIEDDGGAPDAHDGRFFLGYRVTDNGDGTWHYEYALYNMNSDRSAQSFSVPVPAGVSITNVGFHDVDYHSGDGEGGVTFDGTGWPSAAGSGALAWSTDAYADNPNANALRWGTLYNFRFDASTGPVAATATVGLFRPGSPTALAASTLGPDAAPACPWDCGDGNGTVDTADFLALLSEWGMVGSPCDLGSDGVGTADFLDLLSHWGACP